MLAPHFESETFTEAVTATHFGDCCSRSKTVRLIGKTPDVCRKSTPEARIRDP